MRRTIPLLATLMLLASTGCASDADQDPGLLPAPADDAPSQVASESEGRSTGITVSPATAAAGQTVELAFSPRNRRGIAFTLDRSVANGWRTSYYLTAPSSPGGRPTWWSVEESEDRGWDDLGVSGPGPDVVRIPGVAEPGEYRICTANARDRACGAVTVT
jgi:hypothetical protein